MPTPTDNTPDDQIEWGGGATRIDGNPPWWPTSEQKRHADAGCAHPDDCRLA